MCVVAIAQEKALTEEHVKKMFGSNRDGGGVAFRKDGRVHWRKGLSEQEMIDQCLTLPIPYVAHFRIASCGGIRADLTHPFPIAKDVPLNLKGSTTGAVLFHNGHYHRWKDQLLSLATGSGLRVPTGAWSDSRLMAWVAAHCGINILPFFDEKIVAYGVEEMDIWGTGWTEVDGLVVSNRTWEHSHMSSFQNMVCKYKQCKVRRVDDTMYCAEHQGGREVTPILNRETHRGSQGVTPDPASFRGSNSDAHLGSPLEKAVEEVEESLRRRRAQGKEGEEGAEGFVPDATLEERSKIHAWVRRLNPKAVRGVTRLPPDDADTAAWMQGYI